MSSALLPVHGFVLAGGESRRMGTDKARLDFRGRPMIEIAVEKLRGFCANVGIAGNRDDLAQYATVVHENRIGFGPAAGIEAGLRAAQQPWALFIPVDVPLAPMEVLRAWVEETIGADEPSRTGSYLLAKGELQPAFCLLRSQCMAAWSRALETGQRKLSVLLGGVLDPRTEPSTMWSADKHLSSASIPSPQAERLFANVNTPQELAEAEAWTMGQVSDFRGGPVQWESTAGRR